MSGQLDLHEKAMSWLWLGVELDAHRIPQRAALFLDARTDTSVSNIQHKEGDEAKDEPEEAQENEEHVVLGMWRVMIVDC